jgi:hypothetical protein
VRSRPAVPSRQNDGADTIQYGESKVSHVIVFTLGYLVGGMTALVIVGLTVAARKGDSGQAEPAQVRRGDGGAFSS